MAGIAFFRRHGRAVLFAGMLASVVAPAAQPALAATLSWASRGPFETCLEAESEGWLNGQAERVVNEDTTVRGLDDAAVVAWTVEALKRCAAKGAASDATSEERFGMYMAQWRQHIYDLATDIRKKGQSD
jgi:hypothetical protein